MVANKINTTNYSPTVIPSQPQAIADTGATGHYISPNHIRTCTHITPTNHGPTILAANGHKMTPTHSVTVPLAPALSKQAQQGHVLRNLSTGSLISIGNLCDDNCTATFSKNQITVTKNGTPIIHGTRNKADGLWYIPLPHNTHPPYTQQPLDTTKTAVSHTSHDIYSNIPTCEYMTKNARDNGANALPSTPKQHHANSTIRCARYKNELANFYHAVTFSPAPSTFVRAIHRGHFSSWPGLTTSLINKHLTKSIATSKGHLRMQFQNLHSTKTKYEVNTSTPDIAPTQEPSNPRTNNAFLALIDNKEFARSYSDQTGRFPITSSRGNKYVFIFYAYDANAILATAIPNRQGSTICAAWTKTYKQLQQRGYAPLLHIIDNECSNDIKQAFTKHNVTFQRVPPHIHRRNAAERAIQTWKAHFISGLITCDPSFPLSEWDHLIPQCNITINLLRSSRRQPHLSAYTCLFGHFDFNKTPLAIPGTRAIVHETPQQRTSWAPHGIDAYYVGPSLEHYRCYKFFIPKTNTTRDATTVDWFPTAIKYPQITTETYLKQTAEDLLHILSQRTHKPTATLTFGSPIMNAYIQIAEILQRATTPVQITGIKQQHLTQEPRVINAKSSTSLDTGQEPRVLTGIPSKETGDTTRT